MIAALAYLPSIPHIRAFAFVVVCLLALACISQVRSLRRPTDRGGFYW